MRAALLSALVLLVALFLWLRGEPLDAPVAPVMEQAVERAEAPDERSPLPAVSARVAADGVDDARRAPPPAASAEDDGCALELRVVDAESAAPASSRVTLWQLDAPSDERWMAGDRRLASFDVPARGRVLEDLAPGRYRAVLHSTARGAPYQEPFVVAGGLTRVQLTRQAPGRHHVRVRLYDEEGRRLVRVERKLAFDESWRARPAPPPGVRPARQRPEDESDDEITEDEEDFGEAISSSLDTWHWIDDPGDGFDFGLVTDDARGETHATRWSFRLGEAMAELHVAGSPPRDRAYVAVLPDPRPYRESIHLPDGRTGADVPDAVQVRGGWLPAETPRGGDPWTLLEIKVRAAVEGFEPLEYEELAGDGAARRFLEPLER